MVGMRKVDKYKKYGDYSIIYLDKGKQVLIDTEDLGKVLMYHWHDNGKGYARTAFKVAGKLVHLRMHRYLLNLDDSSLIVDHINHNTLDNRKCNLRVCTRKENGANTNKPITNTSGYKGVSYDKSKKRWVAYIWNNNKRLLLGRYKSKKDAINTRRRANFIYQKDYSFEESMRLASENNISQTNPPSLLRCI